LYSTSRVLGKLKEYLKTRKSSIEHRLKTMLTTPFLRLPAKRMLVSRLNISMAVSEQHSRNDEGANDLNEIQPTR
jgi:hypothetical protein